MSLVEDILDVLHMVLEYFGVPPDMLVPVWDSPFCGQYRSIVRMMGANLPLKPTPRVHFQIPLVTYRPHRYVDIPVDAPAVPSLADIMWVLDSEEESSARTRNFLHPKKNQDVIKYPTLTQNHAQRGGTSIKQLADPDALKKISELESELLKLRAQIAKIVTAAPSSGLTELQDASGSPLMSPSLIPALTSTPRSAPPPPPPPPPPLPYSSSSSVTSSVLELIKQRQKNESKTGPLQPQHLGISRGLDNKQIPSMLDVLKDLNQVKLRSVKRSPGGTPVRRRHSKGGPALLNDPTALIAEALKRKFAQHYHNSPDKENSLERSPFGSPETQQVSLHNRRSLGRRYF